MTDDRGPYGEHIPVPEGRDGRVGFVSRRRLLQLAGAAGLAATVSACSHASAGKSATGFTIHPISRPAPAPTAATGTGPSPAPMGTSATLLCRDSWGARPARAGGRPHTITRMTVHHSGVVLGDNRNVTNRLRQHQRYHQDQHGWIDIAYHMSVDRNGNIFELRSPEIAGDTATGYDTTGHFLVLCEGDFNEETVTDAQLHGAAVAFVWAAQEFHITSDTLAGHCDVDPVTDCPGAGLYAHLTSGDLKRRIDELLAAGPVDLQRVCGPEAAEIVAGIETGR